MRNSKRSGTISGADASDGAGCAQARADRPRTRRRITRPEIDLFVSDSGFSVEALGRAGILYKEGDHVMNVGSEVAAPGHGMAIWANSIKAWQSPFDKAAFMPAVAISNKG